MSSIHKILFAIRDPDESREGGIAKVASLAKACDASLELFHAISTPLVLPTRRPDTVSLEALKNDTVEVLESRLDKMAAAARHRGVEIATHCAWDHPPHEAIIRRAEEIGANLIVVQGHDGPRAWTMKLTDWELLRLSEIPVLILRNSVVYQRPAILAAVDPSHAHAKPVDLDGAIIGEARDLSETLHGELHVAHANHPALHAFAYADPLAGPYAAMAYEEVKELRRDEFNRFVEGAHLHGAKSHIVEGDPVKVIPQLARKLGASIVVMGAVSRSGLQRIFIGNTAESVLEKLRCDVLVMKPGGFGRRVSPERRGSIVLTPTATQVLS